MTTLYTILTTSIVLNIVLFLILRNSYLDNKYLKYLIDSLEEELNEEELKSEK